MRNRLRVAVVGVVVAGLLMAAGGCQGRAGEEAAEPPAGTIGSGPADEALGPYCGGYAVGVYAPGAGRTFPADVRVCQAPPGGFQYWLVAEPANAAGGAGGSVFPKAPVTAVAGQTRTYPVVLGAQAPIDSVRFIFVLRVPDSAVAQFEELRARDASSNRAAFPNGTDTVSNVYRSVLVSP